ncbi:MAG: AAA domain-containing protein [bacterium]|nr:AAA domain-containing protein [bacterium]
MNRRQRVEESAQQWRTALVDPTGSNRLVYYRDLKAGTMDLSPAAPGALGKLLTGKPGSKVRLSKLFPINRVEHPQADHTIEEAVRRARTINRKAVENFEELGVHTLFLAQGFATWTPTASKSTPASPVLLCPAGLARTGAAESDFELSLDGEWMVNEALLQHLSRKFDVEVSGEELLGTKLSDARLDDEEVEEIFADLGARVGRVPDFELDPGRLVLGNFMYKKLPMVNDIENNLDVLVQHDLIAALAGDEGALEALRSRHSGDVDPSRPDTVAPTDEFLALDADSSQNRAINAALGGGSFVLEGPPGTGKSQTISNLIAAMMARGKKVLFVAEKRAAIDAVTKRLAQVGLDEFVMDLHGGTMGRRKMAQQLEGTLTAISQVPPAPEQPLHRDLERDRARLSGYVQALHQTCSPWGMSFFEIQARRLKMGALRTGAPGRAAAERMTDPARGVPVATLREFGREQIRSLRDDLVQWAELWAPLWEGPSAWAEAMVSTAAEIEKAQDLSERLVGAIAEAGYRSDQALAELGIPDPETVVGWVELLVFQEDLSAHRGSGDLPSDGGVRSWSTRFGPPEMPVSTEVSGRIRVHDEETEATEQADQRMTEELEAAYNQMTAMVKALALVQKGGLSLLAARMFSNRFQKALNQATVLGYIAEDVTNEEALERARQAQQDADQSLRRHQTDARRRRELAPLQRRWLGWGGVGDPRLVSDLDSMVTVYRQLLECLEEISELVSFPEPEQRTLAEIDAWAQDLYNNRYLANRFPELARLKEKISNAGLASMLRSSSSAGVDYPQKLADALEKAWLGAISRAVLAADPILAAFEGSRHLRLVSQFRDNDRAHIATAPNRIRRHMAEEAIGVFNAHRDQDSLIRREAAKKTRHLPLRRLFENAPDVLMALRPCWAMSPLDVAQNLPTRRLFDLVIFDEASQVLPCDAISALLRGRRAVVAGDSRQLPPTVFFDGLSEGSEGDDEEMSDTLTDYESILDVMGTMLPRRRIDWHYRSRDERLIAFSNHNIYHGSLTTFPGAGVDDCLQFELVEHRPGEPTNTRSNPAEVTRVVDLMIQHARQRPHESLGVIAMGRYHADRIEETLRRRLRDETDPGLEHFFRSGAEERAFVKNLERVQGDERDAIILSIGYGKNSAGRLVYRFGPLNQEGGERRLNVAVTRARSRMTLVSSFSHTDMDPGRSSAEGVKQLRGYLKYVESRGMETGAAGEQTPLNPFEVDVFDKLTHAGLSVVPQYGSSGYRIDFAVRHPTRPGRFVLAVEADGASYHSSPTARDRDRLRQEHLENLGWRFCRIWSTNWFNDHQREVDRVLDEYRRALQAGDAVEGREQRQPTPEAKAHQSETPRRKGKPSLTPGLPITEYHPDELVALARWVMSDGLLRTDAQIFEEMFAELGYGRRGPRIKEALKKAIEKAQQGPSRSD